MADYHNFELEAALKILHGVGIRPPIIHKYKLRGKEGN